MKDVIILKKLGEEKKLLENITDPTALAKMAWY